MNRFREENKRERARAREKEREKERKIRNGMWGMMTCKKIYAGCRAIDSFPPPLEFE